MRILIVDDDTVDRQIVKRALHLGSMTYELVEAQTVDEGLALFDKKDFDLVLIDFRMPGKDGIELVIAIRDGYPDCRSAIVMMSNSEDEQVALDAIRAGAQDFILKTEITASRLRRSILHAQTRFELEKQLQESYAKVKQLAERDALTGLANRHLFDESLKFTIANNRRADYKVALLLIDLDNFKYVNDNFGHDVGDLLLQRVVKRIHACLRGSELFARLGGDEFAISLGNLSSELEASRVAQRILLVLETPFEIKGRSFTSGASIGIALHPDNGENAEELVKHADIAMYRAKKKGKNQACFFEEEMQQQFASRYEIEQELRQAIDNHRFSLTYQPVYSALSHELGGYEVFLQWHDAGGLRSPEEFLPIAEESKLILQLGRWLIERAMRQQVRWAKEHNHRAFMSINLSPVQLSDRGLTPLLQELLPRYGAEASQFIFEVSELALNGLHPEVRKNIDALRALGCKVALGDFGAGLSSIANLRDYPFDLIKIERSFLPGPHSSEQDRALFASVVKMIQALNIETVVVGTESVEQVELCCQLGVNQLQGHFFAKAETAQYIENNYLLRNFNPDTDKPHEGLS
ncbi:putative bifunctional diguanylate cyclase/phosphodiesterase [Agaribacterium haliotis]|uniref:putative bifunctional diguanylate cyclase/phosphodiesterase n=1 Tax=Agaribacterium haliotis TaxID=2013869 RepID=UPI000BB573F2|nr:GGDEF domain-containing response regulator [Agaribacterium haliotis]